MSGVRPLPGSVDLASVCAPPPEGDPLAVVISFGRESAVRRERDLRKRRPLRALRRLKEIHWRF
jgi:hypothetical protein